MKKGYDRLSWYVLTLLVLTIASGFWRTTGLAEEPPGRETSGRNQSSSIKPDVMTGMFKGAVVEVIDAGRQFYVHIDTGEQMVWVAVPAFDGKLGDKVLVPPCVPIADFESKKLNRVFKMICFVGSVRRVDGSAGD
ncbi:MAG: hypothetical protein WBV21_19040 [Desulfobacterales bacterium]